MSPAMRRRRTSSAHESVLVTGIGTILPGADGVEDFWRHLRNGDSQLGFLSCCDPGDVPVRVAGEIREFDHRRHLPVLPETHAAKYSRDILIVMSAVEQARGNAGLHGEQVDPRRTMLIASCSRGPMTWVDSAIRAEFDGQGSAPHFSSKNAMLHGLAGAPATLAAINSDVQGVVTTLSSACVGGNHAIGLATDALWAGRADVAYVVGYEFPLAPVVLNAFGSMGAGVLSAEQENPTQAMKPYTRQRNGMVLSEGAVALCLERETSARHRKARAYAEVLGHEATNEAANPFSMDPSGKHTADAIHRLLADCGTEPADVRYYCGHGTATKHNDLAESRALGVLYEGRPRSSWPPIGSIKPIYGHLLGGAGVVNAAATALMIHHGSLVPTINCTDPDPECDHDHVAEGARPVDLTLAVSLAFAIGSQTSALAMGAAA
ncbi:MAG TPA: beta-ketoacyl-[acyl-carrier-protein] synthase family protein [Pseudonocardiaceae bacterium]|jgi:3-oxoacyl-[acyl-carrier-protein] synthase II|nr:beta-ketoacyl-[acyl-carrier-protein] synthase family protein [Pseudonocardiaceae bacterium]